MDALMLSRLQFAATVCFHFLFVPLTLGITVLLAVMEIKYVRTGDEEYRKLAKFFGKLFLINFVLGVVTGIPLEFQFGTNWSRYSIYVGDVFGSLLAIEATAAFFIESTFIGVWAFGWKKLSAKLHAAAICLVAFATNLSAVWILIANSWMQNPVGYEIRNGRAELTDFVAVITQKWVILTILHQLSGAYVVAGFFVLGVSAYQIMKNRDNTFKKSFRLAAGFTLAASLFVAYQGHTNAEIVAHKQPMKLAAMESHWETGVRVPVYMIAIPDVENLRNSVEAIPIPGFLSFLAFKSFGAEVKGLNDKDLLEKYGRPPVLPTFLSFRAMVALGGLFILLSLIAYLKRNNIENHPLLMRALMYVIPLPYIANLTGWIVAEVGRQPWIVYGIMKTSDAVSPVPAGNVAASLAGFVAVYTLLGALDAFLLFKNATKPLGYAPAAVSGEGKGGE